MSESESTASPESSSHVNESLSDSSSPSPDTSSFRSPSGESNLSSPPSPQSSDSSSSFLPGNSDSSSSSSLSSPTALPQSSSESDSSSDGASSSSGPPSKTKSSPDPENSPTSDPPSGSSSTSPKKHNEPPSSDDSIRADNGKSPTRSSRSSTDSPVVPFGSFPNDMPTPGKPVLSNSSAVSTNHSDGGGTSAGAIISLALVGVVITLIAVFIVITRRKKRRDALIDRYKEPGSFPVKSVIADNYYYRSENSTGHSGLSDSYGAPQRLSNASGSMFGSQRDYGFFSGSEPGGKSWFRHEELMDITDGFSQQNLIGEGGFGCVYKGALSDGRQVAVKQLKAGGGQGDREFRAEVEVISRVHHRHLVSLVGYCITEFDRLLVYEFVPNNTLEHHLHGKGVSVMEWSKRLKIAFGAAKGLAYLHEDCHPRIIHRDIKSANILVDNDWEAKVADFGLAKLSNDTNTHVSTRVMGTFGYLAPEYALSGKLTDRSDVFSFGVVLLELITGRKPVDTSRPLGDESLVEWARPLLVHALESGNLDELVDSRLEKNYLKNEMFRMVEAAAACIRHSAPKRPRMVQVMRALDSDRDLGDLSNGVKFGQSQVYESGQYSADIQRFRRMALGTEDFNSDYGFSSEYGGRRSSAQSGYRGRDHQSGDPSNSWHSGESSSEYSGDSETRAMFPRPRESR